ncbi:MAG TPA: alpha-ribazole phosphatase [Pelotomaculum sp.]|nr:alpha-ribazole phosphatase [Pelotomaculum sp.]
MKTEKIYLTRHGEISNNGEKRYIGQIDLTLNDNGWKQAACLRDALARVPLGTVICSDLIRSVATAGIICEKHALKPVVRKELREIDMGLWDGLTFQEVRRSYSGEFEKRGADILNYKPPGGESFAQCAGRVMPVLDAIVKAARGNILIVGHAGINRIIISRALGLPLEYMFRIKQDYGCLNILLPSEHGWQVEALNLTF